VQVQCGAGGVSKEKEKLRSGRSVPACLHACISVSLSVFFSCGDVRSRWTAKSSIHFQCPTSMLDIANAILYIQSLLPRTPFGDPDMS
jgi:hypothetical protein